MEISAIDFIARLFGLPIAFALDPLAPMVVFGFCRRLGLVHDPLLLQPQFDGFASDGFLIVATLLYVAHVLGDKIPPIAHLLDALGMVIKPLASAFMGLCLVHALDAGRTLHLFALALAVVGSVTITTGLHVVRVKARLVVSATTLGTALPVVSSVETVAAAALSTMIALKPVLAVILAAGASIPVWLLARSILGCARRSFDRIGARLRSS